MLSWEYPPRTVGGISRHVQELSEAMVAQGHELHVITANHPRTAEHETVNGVHVHRVKYPTFDTPDFVSWVHQLNWGMVDYAGGIIRSGDPVDVIHGHDWLVAHAGVALKKATGIPFVATMHATESGRMRGIRSDLQRYIHTCEWYLCYEAWRVIVCSWFMQREVRQLHGVPTDKMDVLPNGIYHEKFKRYPPSRDFRRMFAYDHEPIVLFVGRMVPEKGAHILVEAAAKVLRGYGDAKFIIVGKGGMVDYAKQQAEEMGLGDKILFVGYVSDQDLLRLGGVANVWVVPSTYEPFGITALEAMASGTPVVVADTGGLSEIVDHAVTGIKTYPGDGNSLAWGILEVLKNPGYAGWLRDNAYNKVLSIYHWPFISERTIEVYQRVLHEWRAGGGQRFDGRPAPREVRA